MATSARAALPLHWLEQARHRAHLFQIYHLMGLGKHPLYGVPGAQVYTLFVDAEARQHNVPYIPCTYGNAEEVFRAIRPQLAVIACAEKDGLLSWGVSHDVSGALYEMAEQVVLEINQNMPFTGKGVPYQRGEIIRVNYPLPEYTPRARSDDVSERIAWRVVDLIPDGATIQIGVGSIPEQVCKVLVKAGKRVRIWTEAFSDPLMELCEAGLVEGRPVCAFLWGSRRLYEWANGADLDMRPLSIVNHGIGLDSPLHAILGALEVDWQGNVNAEVLNGQQYSGTGGYCDFVSLAWKTGGKAIVAFPSRTSNGKLRIVPRVEHVTSQRAFADWFVTEKGAVCLRAVPLPDRERLMRSIA